MYTASQMQAGQLCKGLYLYAKKQNQAKPDKKNIQIYEVKFGYG